MLLLALLACQPNVANDAIKDGTSEGHDPDEPIIDPDEVEANGISQAGDFALELLRSDVYDKIVVEIDYVVGWAPNADTRDRVAAVLEDLCQKPGGVEVIVDDELPAQGSPSWTVVAADGVEVKYRDRYRDAEEGVAVIYGLWLDGHSDRDSESSQILGYAVHGSSLVMFGETIGGLGGGPLTGDPEPTVMAHELGHILGLVNNGVEMVGPHEDAGHLGHDGDEDCLMYWAVETSDVLESLLGGEPDFDGACRADLKAAGGK